MLLVAILRLVHILAAFSWFGLGLAMTVFVAPAAAAAGESGLRFFKSLFTNTRFASAIPAAAGITTLFGILLYLFGGSTSHFTQLGNIVLGIGALAGLAATIHGGAITSRATNDYAAALSQHIVDNQPVPAAAAATLREKAMTLGGHTRISFYLMVIALLGMASARYL
jgi:uncharacterized membrane protein